MKCEICQGQRTIRLPVHKPVTVMAVPSAFEPTAGFIDASSRDYPCPECAPSTSPDRVKVKELFLQVDARHEDIEDYRKFIVDEAAYKMGRALADAGLIRMQTVPDPNEGRELIKHYRFSVGVVSPQVITDMDAQREAAEEKFAQLFRQNALAEILNWGSRYNRPVVEKHMIDYLLGEALKTTIYNRPRKGVT